MSPLFLTPSLTQLCALPRSYAALVAAAQALCLSVSKTLTATNHPSVNTIIPLNIPQRSGRSLQTFATKLGDDEEILDTIRLSLVAFCSVFKLQVCALREVSLITRTRMLELTAAPCTVCTARLVQRACLLGARRVFYFRF